MKEKDLFIIHSKSDEELKKIYDGILSQLKNFRLKVWEYGDWSWKEIQERLKITGNIDPEYYEIISDVEREAYGLHEERDLIEGDVDKETLEHILIHTPGIIVLEIGRQEATEGIKEEMDILDRDVKRFQLSGGVGMVRSDILGYFSKQHPYLISSTFLFERKSWGLKDKQTQSYLLNIFALKMINRGIVSRYILFSDNTFERKFALFWKIWEQSVTLLDSCPALLLVHSHEEIAHLVEDLVCLARDILLNKGKKLFIKKFSEMTQWIINHFNNVCSFKRLGQKGLEATIDILEASGPEALGALKQIYRNPSYWERPGCYVVSRDILIRSVEAIAHIKGKSSIDLLIKDIKKAHSGIDVRLLIEVLGILTKDTNQECKLKVTDFLIGLNEDGRISLDEKGACVQTIGRISSKGVERWLSDILKKEKNENIRRSAVLAFMNLFGEKSSPIAIEFLKDANVQSRTILASAAWRVDTDDFYDALLECELHENEKLRGNILYSLVRARNSRANKKAIQALTSKSSYLKQIAVVVAGDCINYCKPSREEKQKLINALKDVSIGSSEVLKNYAFLALLKIGQEEYRSDAEELVLHYLTQEKIKLARVALADGGVNLVDWPESSLARKLLFHPVPEIRHVMAYIIGYQRREEFLEDLLILQRDISLVIPLYRTNHAMEVMGRTISEGALLAIRRIEGKLPFTKVDIP